jgi:hypothetical protein
MRKILLSAVLFAATSTMAQTLTPFIIEHCIDKMTDKEYYFAKKKLICSNESKTRGFTITPSFRSTGGSYINTGFMCKNVNIGTCDENDELIILFDDDSKITLTSWNKFNCEGNVYFNLSDEELAQLSTKKINSIRFMNGRSYDTLTSTLKVDQKDYFIRAYTNQKVVEIDCSK